MDHSKKELSAIVRLAVYGQCFLDDMDSIVQTRHIYKGQIKVHAKSLCHLVSRASKTHLAALLEKPEHADTVANAWHALDGILSTVSKMSIDEMIEFSNQLKEYEESKAKIKDVA